MGNNLPPGAWWARLVEGTPGPWRCRRPRGSDFLRLQARPQPVWIATTRAPRQLARPPRGHRGDLQMKCDGPSSERHPAQQLPASSLLLAGPGAGNLTAPSKDSISSVVARVPSKVRPGEHPGAAPPSASTSSTPGPLRLPPASSATRATSPRPALPPRRRPRLGRSSQLEGRDERVPARGGHCLLSVLLRAAAEGHSSGSFAVWSVRCLYAAFSERDHRFSKSRY